MLLSPVLKIDDDVEAKNMKYDMKENKIKERTKKYNHKTALATIS